MNLQLSNEQINSLTSQEQEELFTKQTEKHNYLNQTIDDYKFSVISALPELQKLADRMKNAAFHYKNLIMKGEYLILTIDNGQGEDFTNFGIRKESNNLIFDESVKLKLYMNRNSPEHVWDAFKLYAKKNNIAYTQ